MIPSLTLQTAPRINSHGVLSSVLSWLISCHPVSFQHPDAPGRLIIAVAKVPEWFPGTGFKRLAREWHETLEEMVSAPHKFVKDQMVTNICILL
jgi:hypothetical protein